MNTTLSAFPIHLGILSLTTVLFITTSDALAQVAESGPQMVVVKMVDKSSAQWRFEPAEVTVKPGDTVRFVLEDAVPHNVEFKKVPKGTKLGEARMGPFLMTKGETYDIVIDGRFAAGIHEYVCTPHEPMGMKGTIKVTTGPFPSSSK